MAIEISNKSVLLDFQIGVREVENLYNIVKDLDNIENQHLIDSINAIKGFLFSIYAGSIATFCTTFKDWQPDETQEEYDQISMITKKWGHIFDKADDEEYENFLDDLIDFSNVYPSWFNNGVKMYDFFRINIWKGIFEEYEVATKYYLNKFQRLLEKSSNKYQALIESNFVSLDPFQFEEFICELFRCKGYQSTVTKKTGDFGVDVIAQNTVEKIAIQVKKYTLPNKVSNIDVQKILGSMQYKEYKADRAIIITTSGFTSSAYNQAEGLPVELWNADKLKQEIQNNMVY